MHLKKILLVLLILSLSKLEAQYLLNKFGEPIPFSKIEKYKDIINRDNIPQYIIPIYDNNDLCKKYNSGKTITELGSSYCGGINLETSIKIKKEGIAVQIDKGTIWLYKITSTTSAALDIFVDNIAIPSNCYISFYPYSESRFNKEPQTFNSNSINETKSVCIDSKEIIIEYFEPNQKYNIKKCDS